MTHAVSQLLVKHYRGPDAELETDEFYCARLDGYRTEWLKWEDQILEGLYHATGLSFYLPVIDATFAPMMPQFSTPLTLNYRHDATVIVDELTHELIHILLSDNIEKIDIGVYTHRTWPDEELLVQNHILVHALSEYVYASIMNEPLRIDRDKQRVAHNAPYAKAWEIVAQTTSLQIRADLRSYIDAERLKLASI